MSQQPYQLLPGIGLVEGVKTVDTSGVDTAEVDTAEVDTSELIYECADDIKGLGNIIRETLLQSLALQQQI